MRALGHLPLGLLRVLGAMLGWVLYAMVPERRHVVMTNLRLCFPRWDEQRRRQVARSVFVYFAQSWMDRGWLWHASPDVLRRRLTLSDPHGMLSASGPAVYFAPHFVGLDAGWTRLAMEPGQRMMTIYTPQSNPGVDAWVKAGRARLGAVTLLRREDGVKRIIKAMRQGEHLYLLPDMNFGTEESVFVPFFGVSAATVPSLSRFASLAGARVVPVLNLMNDQGYEVRVLPAWTDFPTQDSVSDTATMNLRLQDWIDQHPAQYFWVHRRFKSRPPNEPSVYD